MKFDKITLGAIVALLSLAIACASSDEDNSKSSTDSSIEDTDRTCVGNPIVRTMYTADPTARVMNGKLFLFPSTDIDDPTAAGYNDFKMPSYNVFSSEDLIDWTDHGCQVDQNNISWITPNSNTMWAPDCIEKGGKYYFYFPTWSHVSDNGCHIGVCVADDPEGPYTMPDAPISGVNNIDPNTFIDDDGTPYIYWGGGDNNSLCGSKLCDNMVELDGVRVVFENLPSEYKEASFVFKRGDIYYLTFSCDFGGGGCALAYATGSSPLGPFEYKGTFMAGWSDCWTNHHSIVEYNDEWILFYHHNDISGQDKLRSVCADYVSFASDGAIEMVNPTYRGIGTCDATKRIDIDRYSSKSDNITISRTDDSLPANWCIERAKTGSWLTFDRVQFPANGVEMLEVCYANNGGGGVVEVRADSASGELIASINIPAGDAWGDYLIAQADVSYSPSSLTDLYISFSGSSALLFSIDWIRFK